MNRRVTALIVGALGFVLGSVSTEVARGQNGDKLEGSLQHLGFAVRDIDKASKDFGEAFGVQVPKPTIVRDIAWGPSYGNRKMNAKVVQFVVAGIRFELLEGFDGDSPWKDHIAKHGEGLHHIGITVPDVKATREMLLARGGKWTQNYLPTMSYVDLEPRLPFTIEVMAPLSQQAPPAGGNR